MHKTAKRRIRLAVSARFSMCVFGCVVGSCRVVSGESEVFNGGWEGGGCEGCFGGL